MALKSAGNYTPSVRHYIKLDRSGLWKGKPEKSLMAAYSSSGGRNNLGRLTSFRKGGGAKKRYRIIDFKRCKFNIEAVVKRIEYDPHRTAFIALIEYTDGVLSYILAPHKMAIGDKVMSSDTNIAEIKLGNAMSIKNIPVGTLIHNIELKPKAGAQVARAAGAYAQIISKDSDFVLVRLRSGEIRRVPVLCMATIGVVSNLDNQNTVVGKAGRSRQKGIRPSVRGVVMNPVDHPHGGGEGKTSGGRHPVTPWGKSTKGKKTRKVRKNNIYIVTSRRDKKS